MKRPNPLRPLLLSLFALPLAVSCGPEEDTRLFQEDGVWALQSYDLGSGNVDIQKGGPRENAFLLRFKSEDMVVAAGTCASDLGANSGVGTSTCKQTLDNNEWLCRCFSYTYEEDVMVWTETTPGAGGGDGADTDGDTEGGGAGQTIGLRKDGARVIMETLPLDLFGSDGESASHVFLQKADALFTSLDDNADGTPDLEMCNQTCFPSEG